MQIFDPIPCGNAADITNGCQMMSYSHLEKDLNTNENLKLKRLINCCFSQKITKKLRA